MTNEEALKIINEYGLNSRGYQNLKEAIFTAISALESQRWFSLTDSLPPMTTEKNNWRGKHKESDWVLCVVLQEKLNLLNHISV